MEEYKYLNIKILSKIHPATNVNEWEVWREKKKSVNIMLIVCKYLSFLLKNYEKEITT